MNDTTAALVAALKAEAQHADQDLGPIAYREVALGSIHEWAIDQGRARLVLRPNGRVDLEGPHRVQLGTWEPPAQEWIGLTAELAINALQMTTEALA